jgi:hypothetical protein
MKSPFRKQKPDPVFAVRHPDLDDMLPASARPLPEVNRFKPLAAELPDLAAEDGPDEELEFLTSLAQSVDRDAKAPPVRPARFTAPQIGAPALREEVDLSVFRDTLIDKAERDRPNVTVADVDIDDLMEDLATTRAALRARKAA